ncbi:MAG: acetamidase/formamidase family protein [Burkholderiaceae bacterium]|nr:acetamidase/formamidase family protein [Burkholderiaceae bacterium]
MKPVHSSHARCVHCTSLHSHWDRSLPSALTVADGAVLTMACPDASNGLLGPNSTAKDIAQIDFGSLDPLCGPIHVEGAEPGDVLQVEVLDIELASWGWTGLLKGFGLLADEFPQPYFRSFDLTRSEIDVFGLSFPLRPMMGVLGVAPAASGRFASITPTNAGGNIDVRYLGPGSTIYLPVFNSGAMLSGGDGHALQGEGEISGTAIEAPMTATLRVKVLKHQMLAAPVIDFSTARFGETEFRDFLGIGPDLYQAARDATRYAVDALAAHFKVEPFEAYAILGMVGELRIHEIVDQPNWIVGCMVPRRLFQSRFLPSGS